jgi:hypothetical protein
MRKDLGNCLAIKNALDAATIATDTDTNGNDIDTQGFEGGVMSLRLGAYTDGSYTLKVQESDTSGSGYTDIPANRLIGTPAALGAANNHDKVGFLANKRWVRIVVTSASTTSGALVLASCVLGFPNQGPVDTHAVAG